jgi:hypothetical protein
LAMVLDHVQVCIIIVIFYIPVGTHGHKPRIYIPVATHMYKPREVSCKTLELSG